MPIVGLGGWGWPSVTVTGPHAEVAAFLRRLPEREGLADAPRRESAPLPPPVHPSHLPTIVDLLEDKVAALRAVAEAAKRLAFGVLVREDEEAQRLNAPLFAAVEDALAEAGVPRTANDREGSR
jgi:hypothetical protein